MNKPSPKLILHCGANAASLEDVKQVRTPSATDSWQPIPHMQLIDRVQTTLEANRLSFGNIAHSLSHGGNRYFGLMEVKGRQSDEDYCWVLGLRNSHDKTFPAGVVAGASVFVCDNLSFSGEVKLARKHTRFINRDVSQLVERAVGRLMDKWHGQALRISTYKDRALDDIVAQDLVIRAVDTGVCSNRLIPAILHEWREPRYPEFQTRNFWSYFNAFYRGAEGESGRVTQADRGAAWVAGYARRVELILDQLEIRGLLGTVAL